MRSVGRWSRFGRFNLVGLLGAALQLLLLGVLTEWWRVPVMAATPLAVEIVVLHNFGWHERFTWRDRKFQDRRERALALWRFHAGNGLISLAGNTVVTYWLVERLRAPVLASAVGAIILCSVLNFFVADRWVYSSSRPALADIDEKIFQELAELLRHRPRDRSCRCSDCRGSREGTAAACKVCR